MANTAHLTQDQVDSINKELITGYTVDDLSESEVLEALERYQEREDSTND